MKREDQHGISALPRGRRVNCFLGADLGAFNQEGRLDPIRRRMRDSLKWILWKLRILCAQTQLYGGVGLQGCRPRRITLEEAEWVDRSLHSWNDHGHGNETQQDDRYDPIL